MKILSFKDWNNKSKIFEKEVLAPSEEKEYTIESRPNHVYKISNSKKYWAYQKRGTDTWFFVENEESVAALNEKYTKSLAVYAKPGHEKYNISNRANFYYRVDSSKKYWEYQKIGTDAWNFVENKESVESLNIKYGKKLKVYDKDFGKLTFANKTEQANFDMAKLYISRSSDKQKEVANAIRKAGSSLGMNENAIAALLGNIGRENNLRWSKITSSHSDPKNKATNFGIVSWQGTRRKSLLSKLAAAGIYKNNKIVGSIDDTILEMMKFIETEMGKSKFSQFKTSSTTKSAADILYKYIVYSMGRYNKPDKYFHAWKNHMWAKAAKDLDIIEYSYS